MVMAEIEVEGAEDVAEALATPIGPSISKTLTHAAELAKTAAAGKSRSAMVSASLMTEVRPQSARVYSNLHPAVAGVIEFGRYPNKKRPPISAIQSWAAEKGVLTNVYAIATAIGRRGIKGRFFMRAGKKAVAGILPQLVEEMGGDWEARVNKRSRRKKNMDAEYARGVSARSPDK